MVPLTSNRYIFVSLLNRTLQELTNINYSDRQIAKKLGIQGYKYKYKYEKEKI